MFASANLPRVLRRSGLRLLDWLLPASCALCGTGKALLCAACREQFFSAAANGARCSCCANPLAQASLAAAGLPSDSDASAAAKAAAYQDAALDSAPGTTPVTLADSRCGACLTSPPAYAHTLVASSYELPLDQLVLRLKFGQQLAYAGLMAQLLRDAVLRQRGYRLPDLLCPVPLGARRLAERGYNQALEIARPLARQLGVPLAPRLLQRVRETAPQSLVTPAARQHNLAGAFALSQPALVQGRHIGLVDDVMTSGSTLQELAALLRRYGASRVSNLVFARTPPR